VYSGTVYTNKVYSDALYIAFKLHYAYNSKDDHNVLRIYSFIKVIFFLVFWSLLLSHCRSASFNEQSKTSNEDRQQDAIEVDQPQSVAGTFLYCAVDNDLKTPLNANTDKNVIGCRLENSRSQKQNIFIPQNNSITINGEGLRLKASAILDKNSIWHWIAYTNINNIDLLAIMPRFSYPGLKTSSVGVASFKRKGMSSGEDNNIADIIDNQTLLMVTKGSYSPGVDFKGIRDADSICQQEADGHNIFDRTWKAFLSLDEEDIRDRFSLTKQRVYNTLGMEISSSRGLFTGPISAQLHDINGITIPDGSLIWTGNANAQGKSLNNCRNWSSSAGDNLAAYGQIEDLSRWARSGVTSCSKKLRLYCIAR
tara:strand:+ start:390 stop:1490 length:1101 start_codon:yes stop_codon:yes gene_type:complete